MSNSNTTIREIINDARKLDQVAKVAFDSVDTDRSGQIDENELQSVMKQIAGDMGAEPPSKEDVKEVKFVAGATDAVEVYKVGDKSSEDLADDWAIAKYGNNGWESTKMINDRLPSSVNVYAQTSYGKLSTVALPDIKGLPLPIITNETETDYIFSFSFKDYSWIIICSFNRYYILLS